MCAFLSSTHGRTHRRLAQELPGAHSSAVRGLTSSGSQSLCLLSGFPATSHLANRSLLQPFHPTQHLLPPSGISCARTGRHEPCDVP